MKYLLLVTVLFLSGCDFESDMTLAKGDFICKDNSGLYDIGYSGEFYIFKCKSGLEIKLTNQNLSEINDPLVSFYLSKREE